MRLILSSLEKKIDEYLYQLSQKENIYMTPKAEVSD